MEYLRRFLEKGWIGAPLRFSVHATFKLVFPHFGLPLCD